MFSAAEMPGAQKWFITLSVMMVAVMQVLDTSVTIVVLPHMQGSLSAGRRYRLHVLLAHRHFRSPTGRRRALSD